MIEHVHDKYLAKQKMAGKRARLYVYACSLGAQIFGLYLRQQGKRACKYIDGAILYGTPWSTAKGNEFFNKNAFGFYSWAIGMNLSETIRNE